MENIKRESIKRYQFTFGVPVFETKLGLSHDMKENMSNYLSNCHDVQKHRTNVKATMTSYFVHKQNDDIKNLSDIVFKYIGEMTNYTTNTNIGSEPSLLFTSEVWGGIYTTGEETILHNHNPFLWSWCYYLKIPDGSSPLVFPESNIIFEPQEDELIIFPSYAGHMVPPCSFDGKRIMIAGNVGLDAKGYLNTKFEGEHIINVPQDKFIPFE